METEKGLSSLKPGNSGIFMSRAWILADTISMQEFWSYELEPMDNKRIPTSEWAKSYCQNGLDIDDYRQLFNLEEDRNYQVIFTGELSSWYSGYPVCEWDEDMNVIEFKAVEIPPDFVKKLTLDDHFTLEDTDNPFDAG